MTSYRLPVTSYGFHPRGFPFRLDTVLPHRPGDRVAAHPPVVFLRDGAAAGFGTEDKSNRLAPHPAVLETARPPANARASVEHLESLGKRQRDLAAVAGVPAPVAGRIGGHYPQKDLAARRPV